ncbi:carboxylating nicotinate-nucleotide diphosphorylase [Pseudomonadota bacterium]
MIARSEISQQVAWALQEDIGTGDITAKLVSADSISEAKVISRQPAILCGQAWFDEVFYQLDKNIKIDWLSNDGEQIDANQTLCHLYGKSRGLLTGERTALNFLQTLSATATHTAQYAKKLEAYSTLLLDTRKTLPGLRIAQKYAVLTGGGHNHRIGLYDGILIKENHIDAAGSITDVLHIAEDIRPKNCFVEIEVQNIDELRQALTAGASRILLDNFSMQELKTAVQINQGQAKLEASGNVSLENIAQFAQTGVDFISVGDLTKNIRAVDLSMLFNHH